MYLGERAGGTPVPFGLLWLSVSRASAPWEAVGVCRQRCWRYDWVIDLDVQKFFDTVPWNLIIKAVEAVTDCPWVLLYVKRWLAAPLQIQDGTVVERDKGTPQGSAVSPILANLFMHFAFDTWMDRNFPDCPWERYADDAVVHCTHPTSSGRGARSDRRADGGAGPAASPLTRLGSSTARTPTVGATTSTPVSRSWVMSSGLEVPGERTAACSRRSCPP